MPTPRPDDTSMRRSRRTSEPATKADESADSLTGYTRVTEGGRVVIPVNCRKALNLRVGDELIVYMKGKELRMMTREQGVRHAQQLVQRHALPATASVVDEFLAERRLQAAEEK